MQIDDVPLSDAAAGTWQAIEVERALGRDAARPEAMAMQHRLGKLSARERIARLTDPGSFHEVGALVRSPAFGEAAQPEVPGDGVVSGTGRIAGRPVVVSANDFTVMGGSSGKGGGLKTAALVQRALDHGLPYIVLLDGGGHRIQEGLDSRHFAAVSSTFQPLVDLSGWVPMVAAMMGSGFASPSNMAGLSDFGVMVRKTLTMDIAGPALVKAATGEDFDKEALGGAAVQADRNGIADLAVDSDDEALAAIQRYLSHFPSNAGEPLPIQSCSYPADRRDEALLTVVPPNSRRAYDVHKVITGEIDRDSGFELKPSYARNVVTMLARLGGRPVGMIANQPMQMAGTLDSPACEKVAHFISVCGAFGLPLVFLVDIPGFLVGGAAERSGLARRSARIIYELGRATVPRLSVVLRKGYGLGFIAMNGVLCRPVRNLAHGRDLRHVHRRRRRRGLPPGDGTGRRPCRQACRAGGGFPRPGQPAGGGTGLRRRRPDRPTRHPPAADRDAGSAGAAPTHQRPAAQVPRHLAHLKASPHHHERDNHAR